MELAQDFMKGKYEVGKTYMIEIRSAEALALFKKAADRYGEAWINSKVDMKPNVDPDLLATLKPADVAKYGKWLKEGEAASIRADFKSREGTFLETRVKLDVLAGTKKAQAGKYERWADAIGKEQAKKRQILSSKNGEVARINQEIIEIDSAIGGDKGGVLQTTVRQKRGWFSSLGERFSRFFGGVSPVDAGGNAGVPEGIAGGSGAGRRGNQEIAGPAGGLRPGEGFLRSDGQAAGGNGARDGSLGEGVARAAQLQREKIRRGEGLLSQREGLLRETGELTTQISRLESIRSRLLEKAGGLKARSEDFRRASVDVEIKKVRYLS
jgi:hypothetical protein